MKLNYCTLFDSYYLTRGLIMYESLKRNHKDFHLYIFAFDLLSESILKDLNYEGITVISLTEFEDKDLLEVKPGRSRAEYCWTATPSTILYCIEKFNLTHCTYIDADLYFYSDPEPLILEMGENSVLITEHRSTPAYDRSGIAGKYCVQFITFKNDSDGLTALKWWRSVCLEWCYDRYEDGKFGDQKYLDDWTTRFQGVHVLQNEGGGLAPWNIQQYDVKIKNGNLLYTNKRKKTSGRVIFYHFHYVKFMNSDIADIGWIPLQREVKKLIYRPYLEEMKAVAGIISGKYPAFQPAYFKPQYALSGGMKESLKLVMKNMLKFNILKLHKN